MTVYAFPHDWALSKVICTGAALIAGGAMIAGAAAFIADGARNTAPIGTATPAASPTTATSTYLAPHCERATMGGVENCAWEPVADCQSDEDGNDAIPDGYAGCRWDAQTAGNREGTSYVIWRRN